MPITTKISLPQSYDSKLAYPLILLNDGGLQHLEALKDRVILVGLIPENRLSDYTPWATRAIRPGTEDFGGKLDEYHNELFNFVLPEIQAKYHVNQHQIVYGGHSLGGLAAIYSLYQTNIPTRIFSVCGSFWYPGFVSFCRNNPVKNQHAHVYLHNGKSEGSKHNNILATAVQCAEQVHSYLSEQVDDCASAFDGYGHHGHVKARDKALAGWLEQQLSCL